MMLQEIAAIQRRDSTVSNHSFRRHFEGWQAGVIAVSIGVLGVALAAPRGTLPDRVPAPVVDTRVLETTRVDDLRRAAWLEQLPEDQKVSTAYEVRRVGAYVREFGRADAATPRDAVELVRIRQDLWQSVTAALAVPASNDGKFPGGAEALRALRALQLKRFLGALDTWESTGNEPDELRELGGDFIGLARRSGWVTPPHRLKIDQNARAALFKRRFSEVTGLKQPPFDLTLDESRALYAFFFSHPISADPESERDRSSWQWLARRVEEFSAIDTTYPADLARGMVLLRLDDPAGAELSLRRHLAQHPDGPYTLRARNHLSASRSGLR